MWTCQEAVELILASFYERPELLEKRLMYALYAQAEDEKILEQQNRFCTLLLLHFESGK